MESRSSKGGRPVTDLDECISTAWCLRRRRSRNVTATCWMATVTLSRLVLPSNRQGRRTRGWMPPRWHVCSLIRTRPMTSTCCRDTVSSPPPRSTSVHCSPNSSPRRNPVRAARCHSAYSGSSSTPSRNSPNCSGVQTATASCQPVCRHARVRCGRRWGRNGTRSAGPIIVRLGRVKQRLET